MSDASRAENLKVCVMCGGGLVLALSKHWECACDLGGTFFGSTLREAIDAAMEKETT